MLRSKKVSQNRVSIVWKQRGLPSKSVVLRYPTDRAGKLGWNFILLKFKLHFVELKLHFVELKLHFVESKLHFVELKLHFVESPNYILLGLKLHFVELKLHFVRSWNYILLKSSNILKIWLVWCPDCYFCHNNSIERHHTRCNAHISAFCINFIEYHAKCYPRADFPMYRARN